MPRKYNINEIYEAIDAGTTLDDIKTKYGISNSYLSVLVKRKNDKSQPVSAKIIENPPEEKKAANNNEIEREPEPVIDKPPQDELKDQIDGEEGEVLTYTESDDSIDEKLKFKEQRPAPIKIEKRIPNILTKSEKFYKKQIQKCSKKEEKTLDDNNPSISYDDSDRSKIILQVRNYVEAFSDKLECVLEGVSKKKYFKSLHKMSTQQLKAILEQIRTELCANKSIQMFQTFFNTGIRIVESTIPDMNGLSSLCESDDGFKQCIIALGCEYSIQTSPRTDLIVKLIYAIFSTYKINKCKREAQELLNNITISCNKDLQSETANQTN